MDNALLLVSQLFFAERIHFKVFALEEMQISIHFAYF